MDKYRYLEQLDKLLQENNEAKKDIESAKAYATNLIDLGLPVIFDKAHFSALVGSTPEEITKMMALLERRYYQEKSIPKKSGGFRTLMIPSMKLKIIQQWILKNILSAIPVSKYATGFVKRRSIVTNAKPHVGKNCIINMDIKDFFPTITQAQVFRIFYYYGYTVSVSYMLSRLCTVNGRLPQGAPTSPYLSNIVCLKLDKRLAGLANKYEATYSRYADDITFSGNYGVQNIVKFSRMIIEDEGFQVNEEKVRVAFKHQRQEVTGLNVSGNRVSINKAYLKQFHQEIYYCKKYGPSDHLKHIGCDKHFYKEHLYGKAYYVNMVDREMGQNLLKMLDEINWDL